MRLSVVVLNWNQASDTIRCARAVEAWGREDVSVIIVDNGSERDDAPRLRDELPKVCLVRSETNRGFAGGSNLGIEVAREGRAEAVLLLNNDARIASPDLKRLERRLEEAPDVGIAGPLVYFRDRLVSAGGRDIAVHRRTHWTSLPSAGSVPDVDYVPGTVALVRREVFDAVGNLDEDFFFGGEMADLCARARTRGFRSVVDPEARAEHDLARSREARERLHVYYVHRNRFLFAKKHHPGKLRRIYFLLSTRGLLAAFRAVLTGRPKHAVAILLGVRDALAGRFGGQNHRVLERDRGLEISKSLGASQPGGALD